MRSMLLAAVVAVTLLSGADYFLRFWKDVVRAPARGEPGKDAEDPVK